MEAGASNEGHREAYPYGESLIHLMGVSDAFSFHTAAVEMTERTWEWEEGNKCPSKIPWLEANESISPTS